MEVRKDANHTCMIGIIEDQAALLTDTVEVVRQMMKAATLPP